MKVINERIGVMNCMSCNKEVPVKKTKTGKLSAQCAWCDFNPYAEPGSLHYKNIMAKVRLDAPAPPAPAAPGANDEAADKPAAAAASAGKAKMPWMR